MSHATVVHRAEDPKHRVVGYLLVLGVACVALASGCTKKMTLKSNRGNTTFRYREYTFNGKPWTTAGTGPQVTVELVANTKYDVMAEVPGRRPKKVTLAEPIPEYEFIFYSSTTDHPSEREDDDTDPPPPTERVVCSVQLVRVSDGDTMVDKEVKGSPGQLSKMADQLVERFRETVLIRGGSIAVASLSASERSDRNRKTAASLQDALYGALVSDPDEWFRVKANIDLHKIMPGLTRFTHKVVRNPKVKPHLVGVDYLVIGTVALESG